MDMMAGVQVTPRLRLVRPIGEGGMGTVWVAYHETLRTEVAVKLINPALAQNNPRMLERFHREAGISAQLKSPHVAQTYDHGMLPDGTPYIVMELLQGQSLGRLIKQRGALSLHETALVIGQTAQALGNAHKQGIIHRDIKPANLFCVETDYAIFIKLLDFGIAKHVGRLEEVELTGTSHLLGSPLYMSPEQFTKAKSVDVRCDLWSLAVVAYRCLARVPPFQGDAIGNVILAVMQQDYQPITTLRPELPASLDAWFDRAFHPDIDKRYQSAKQLAHSFSEIASRAASPSSPRLSLPTITDAEPRTPSIIVPAPRADTAHAETLAATSNPIAKPGRRTGRAWTLSVMGGALLLAGGAGAYAMLSTAGPAAQTPASAQAATGSPSNAATGKQSSPHPDEQPAPSAHNDRTTASSDAVSSATAPSGSASASSAVAATAASAKRLSPRPPWAAPPTPADRAATPPDQPPPPKPDLRDQAGF